MQKSSINKLANSTFTSGFNHVSNDTQRYLIAIKSNRPQALNALSPNLGSSSEHDKPLLHYCAFHNSPTCGLYLLHKGADLHTLDSQQQTVFHVCAYTGHINVLRIIRNQMKVKALKALNEKFIDVLSKSGFKRTDFKAGKLKFSVSDNKLKSFQKAQNIITELYQKYIFGMIDTTFKLFSAPAKNTKRNCIHLACLNRYQKCYNTVQYMLDQVANVDLQFDEHTFQNYLQADKCFPQKDRTDPRLYQDTLQLMKEIILQPKLIQIRKEISKRSDQYIGKLLQSKDSKGHTPMHTASQNGYTGILNLLKKWQGPLQAKSQNRNQLIQLAVHNLARSHIMDLCDASKESDPSKMNFLLSCGEQLNKKKTIFGTFALLETVKAFTKQRNLEPMQLLVLSGADINEQDTNGWTAMHHACDKGLKEVLAALFAIWEEGKCMRPALNKMTNKNYHMLHLAAMGNHSETIQFLVNSPSAKKLGLNVKALDGEKCTILHQSARHGSLEALKKILQFYPELMYDQDVFLNTALHYAATNDHTQCIQFLLYCDSDIDKLQSIRNSRGKLARDMTVKKNQFDNPFTATRSGDVNLVRKMVQDNPKFKAITTSTKDRTLLILAVMNKHLLVVKYLTQAGVDISHKDKTGKTARDYVVELLNTTSSKQQQVVAKNMLALLN